MSTTRFRFLTAYQGEDWRYTFDSGYDLTGATSFRGGFRKGTLPLTTQFIVTQVGDSVQLDLEAIVTATQTAEKYNYTIRCQLADGREVVLLNGDIELIQTYF